MSSPEESAPAPDSSDPPFTAPRYELLGTVAHGGMSTIYRVRDEMMGREFAMKVLRPWVRPERLQYETQITAQLPHPGIVPMHALEVLPDGRPFMVMKLIKGRTLADLLQERSSPADGRPQLLAVFEQVCQTVAFAHAHGVIHRNLKPLKVMIGAFGEVLVIGWGLARVTGDRTWLVDPGLQGLIGTAAYMPPEQAREEAADTRADVFGLGGLLCIILTGEPTFVGGNVRDLLQRSAAGDLTDTFARLDVCGADPELIALAKRCLAPNPADRPADAAEVARAVAELRVAIEEHARRAELDRVRAEEQRKRSRTRAQMVACAVVAVVLLLLNAILLVLKL